MLKLAFTALGQRDPVQEVAVAFPKRKEWLAVLVGIVLAGIPVAAFNLWLDWYVEQRGLAEVERVASRALVIADRRSGMIIRTLNDLGRRGIAGCSPADIEALRTANFWATPVKEISVIDAAGTTLCTDLGIALGARVPLFSDLLTADGDVMIDVLRLGEHRHAMIRIRRVASDNANALAVLIPTELFLPAALPADAGGMTITVATHDGHLLSEGGVSQQTAPNERFSTSVVSDRHNLVAGASLPRAQVMAAYGNLRTVGTVISGMIAVAIFALALIHPTRRRRDPIAEIERALAAGEFVPYFQPIVDITSGRLRGAEVLLRWRKPDGSLVVPAAFIPLLESSGLIIEVTRALMRRVRDEIGPAYRRRPKLQIGFNLAAAHFADETIVKDVRTIFEDSPIRLSQIVLEVTERQPIENLTETRRIIAALQGLGVTISIDDVGTGHSGLSYMLKLGVDSIKIDKMFIDAIGTDRNSATIIETLIELARNLRMDIVAEGVESFEQVVFLRDLGIRAAQGYVFAPPLPTTSFLQLVEAIDPLSESSLQPAPATTGRTAAA
jgi:sensor c-di-GMP phosphodiesterase-like protein